MKQVRTMKFITRASVQSEPNVLFIFGDNMAQWGMGGQAKEMRGEPNAVGIPTKWAPGNNNQDFFSDSDYDKPEVMTRIYARIGSIWLHLERGLHIVLPEDGIGTGLSQLHVRAPKINRYIQGTIRRMIELHG